MRAEILGVGTELLLGQIANTNAQWISEQLAEIGVDVLRHEVVGDNFGRIVEAFTLAASRADVVIATGGLGPTQDDITRPALAAAAGLELIRQPEIEASLRERFARIGREMPESNLLQADVPSGGRAITPRRGSAPGLVVQIDAARVYALPGVPSEMREMMEGTVLPELSALAGPTGIASRILRCVGMAESLVAEILDDLFTGSTNPTVAYLAGGGEVKIRLTAKAASLDQARQLIHPLVDEVTARLGDVVFTTDDEELERVVGRELKARGLTIACAESLTGGGLAARLTAARGSSGFFRGSAVCYAARSKVEVLGVRQATIDGAGTVSEECAREMAAGARHVFSADVGVATTGVAGPEPHGGEPPGRVWIAVDAGDRAHARGMQLPGDREQVRRWTEQAALDLVRRLLIDAPLPDGDRLL
jgi:nicotinamide-nucleotide amidase